MHDPVCEVSHSSSLGTLRYGLSILSVLIDVSATFLHQTPDYSTGWPPKSKPLPNYKKSY